jgi:sulfate adenylyltransferase subunit 2
MQQLDQLESNSIYLIREAANSLGKVALLWSMGKDSTVLLWLARKAFFGEIPFPVVHIDTGFKFPEMYRFRDELAERWGLDLKVVRNETAIASGMGPSKRLECCTALKTEALRQAVVSDGYRGLLLAIRRDEHGVRAKERYFSPRDSDFKWDYQNQPLELWDHHGTPSEPDTHTRIHPVLDWTEIDIWSYILREEIPLVDLYFARGGQRYRSIGCLTCCEPVDSDATTVEDIIQELRTTTTGERSGRAQDKESATAMQKLRALGYM